MKFLKGWFGEKKASLSMWFSLDSDDYRRFHNIIIPGSNGTAQIDHVLISQFGIFIVETKNKTGWIYGSADQATWTQTLGRKKYSFQNPLKQTYRQKKVLSHFLGVAETKIFLIVYFVGDCSFKTDMPKNVIKSGIGRYIKAFQEVLLSNDEVSLVIQQLSKHVESSDLTNSDHIKSLKQRHSSDTICPKCGSELKLKVARSGTRSGREFLGCETFPKCRFTKSA